ncbi:MAG: hypothetical protein HKM93_08035 [Desulfobacteraceae bacterium]|nr:hypothetical protein [Desulfobacteraceae bacterium]
MDDFLYNLRKSTKDKRKDRGARPFENGKKHGGEKHNKKDRHVKKNKPFKKSETSGVISKQDVETIQRVAGEIAAGQKDILHAYQRLDEAEQRKVAALEDIAKYLDTLAKT